MKKKHQFTYLCSIIIYFLMDGFVFGALSPDMTGVPSRVDISGVIQVADGSVITQSFDATIELYNADNTIPTASIRAPVAIQNNIFRFSANLGDIMAPFFETKTPLYLRITFEDDLKIDLPIGTVPMVIKAEQVSVAEQLVDDDLLFFDYANQRIGIGTVEPLDTLHVKGTMGVSGYMYGDGSQLRNIGYKGTDNYNYLRSKNGEFLVVTVNADGQVIVGGRPNVDPAIMDMTVYGSLLVEPNDAMPSPIIAGEGSRFMWHAEHDVLRIGYVPSYYWDAAFSGDHSIAFGYATQATGNYSVVTGGYYNRAVADNAIVLGGRHNTSAGNGSIIVSGEENRVQDGAGIVIGGKQNRVTGSSVVLGGFVNTVSGNSSVVMGTNQTVVGDYVWLMGGNNNQVNASHVIGFGSDMTINHPYTMTIAMTDAAVESVVSRNIAVYADNGMGIGTAETEAGTVRVRGIVSADKWVGDASGITNIKSPESVWFLAPTNMNRIVFSGRLGVGTDQLMESLNVNGGIHLSGEAQPENGTIRYVDDVFSVYKNGEWVSLQMVDTNTQYTVGDGLRLNESQQMDIMREGATWGQAIQWDGSAWVLGYVDQFHRVPDTGDSTPLNSAHRLYYPDATKRVRINASENPDVGMDLPVSMVIVGADTHRNAMIAHDESTNRTLSIAVDPPGVHVNGYYDSNGLVAAPGGGGLMVDNDDVVLYRTAADRTPRPIIAANATQFRIMPTEADPDVPVVINGAMASRSFLMATTDDDAGVYLLDDYYRTCSMYDYSSAICYGSQARERSTVLQQTADGSITFQPGPSGRGVVWQNQGVPVVRLQRGVSGNTLFGITPQWVRSGVDVYQGNIHVSDGYGVSFYDNGAPVSAVILESGISERIRMYADGVMDTPIVTITASGDMGINAVPGGEAAGDWVIAATSDHESVMDIYGGAGKKGIRWVTGTTAADGGDGYSWVAEGDFWVINHNDDRILTIDPERFIGIHDAAPSVGLSVLGDTVLMNQGGLYHSQDDGASVPLMGVWGDQTRIVGEESIVFLRSNDQESVVIDATGMAIGTRKTVNTIDDDAIDLQVVGRMVVHNPIYDQFGYGVYPLDVTNPDGTIVARMVDQIDIDTDSGLMVSGDNTPESDVVVQASPYYNRIVLPDGTEVAADETRVLSIIGNGITIEAQSVEASGWSSLDQDTVVFTNDFLSGGTIDGDFSVNGDVVVVPPGQWYGDARGLRNIPFRWQQVTRNTTAITDPPNYYNEGEIYYTEGFVGIGTDTPQSALDVAATASATTLLVTETLQASVIKPTESDTALIIDMANPLDWQTGNAPFTVGRHASTTGDEGYESLITVTTESRLIIGTVDDTSDYLVDMGGGVRDVTTVVRWDRTDDAPQFIEWSRKNPTESEPPFFRMAYDTSADYPFVWDASNGISFFPQDTTEPVVVIRPNGRAGVLTRDPLNGLDVNGNLAIGYDTAPDNSVVVNGRVGVGHMSPRQALEVSGSVVVGDRLVAPLESGMAVNGLDSRVWIGTTTLPRDLEGNDLDPRVVVSANVAIGSGSLTLKNAQSGVTIARDSTLDRGDTITQFDINDTVTTGLDVYSTNGIAIQRYDTTNEGWQPRMVLDTNGRWGIGGQPAVDVDMHVMASNNAQMMVQSNKEIAAIHLKKDGTQMMIGSHGTGLRIRVDSPELAAAELTIANDRVGINTAVNDQYDITVAGNVAADDYRVSDRDATNGFKSFQTVPTGVIMLWISEVIPPGWEKCNGSNGCPDMSGRLVKGPNDSYSNIRGPGGGDTTTLSAVGHSHDASSHEHSLVGGQGGHSHGAASLAYTNIIISTSHTHSHAPQPFDIYRYLDRTDNDVASSLLTFLSYHNHQFDVSHSHGINSAGGGGHNHSIQSNSHTPITINQSGTDAADGGKHQHTIASSLPSSQVAYFIIKVDES
jgi:hypothetical protein